MTNVWNEKVRVLIVDDATAVVDAFSEALRDHGVDVVGTAANGSDGVRLAEALRPDVILMDLRMRGMDGIKATRKIAAAGSCSKILIMSAYEDPSLISEAYEAGAVGYLVKGTLVADAVIAIKAVIAKPREIAPRP